MLQLQSFLNIRDNTGVRLVKCIKVLGGFKRRYAVIGDIVVVSVRAIRVRNKNRFKSEMKIKKGQVVRALIVQTKKTIVRNTGEYVSFSQNTAVLIAKDNKPMGTRVFASIPRELRFHKMMKIASLSGGFI